MAYQQLTADEVKSFIKGYLSSRGFKNFEIRSDATAVMSGIKLSSSEIEIFFLIYYLKNEIAFLVDFNEVIKKAIPQEQLMDFKDVYFKDTDGILGYGKGENLTYGKGLNYENLTDLKEKLDFLVKDGTKLIDFMADRVEAITQGKFSSQEQTARQEPQRLVIHQTVQSVSITKKHNGWATAGLICSFLCPPIGFILSWVGIANYKKYNSGLGVSIAGIFLSVALMFTVLYFIQQ
ncbi:MAG: hypothetical protein IJ308_07975 [Clostridia bacterium]|nr:hypothetical protein [Clostridia bacterium]